MEKSFDFGATAAKQHIVITMKFSNRFLVQSGVVIGTWLLFLIDYIPIWTYQPAAILAGLNLLVTYPLIRLNRSLYQQFIEAHGRNHLLLRAFLYVLCIIMLGLIGSFIIYHLASTDIFGLTNGSTSQALLDHTLLKAWTTSRNYPETIFSLLLGVAGELVLKELDRNSVVVERLRYLGIENTQHSVSNFLTKVKASLPLEMKKDSTNGSVMNTLVDMEEIFFYNLRGQDENNYTEMISLNDDIIYMIRLMRVYSNVENMNDVKIKIRVNNNWQEENKTFIALEDFDTKKHLANFNPKNFKILKSLFIELILNALKNGKTPNLEKGDMQLDNLESKIELEIILYDNGWLHIRVYNTYNNTVTINKRESKSGLRILKERLKYAYPDNFHYFDPDRFGGNPQEFTATLDVYIGEPNNFRSLSNNTFNI
jgi:hypothetical protein